MPFFDTKEEGAVRPFEDSVGRGMFVSHQWLSPENPDPNFEQLEVLQKTMKNLLRGASFKKVFFLFIFSLFFLGWNGSVVLKHANCNVFLLGKNLKCFFWFKISVSRTWWLWRLRCQSGKPSTLWRAHLGSCQVPQLRGLQWEGLVDLVRLLFHPTKRGKSFGPTVGNWFNCFICGRMLLFYHFVPFVAQWE